MGATLEPLNKENTSITFKRIKMKALLFVPLLSLAIHVNCLCQTDSVVHVATLIVNYNTYKFEGGHISNYICLQCKLDSLPFLVEYQSPGDFGSITIRLKPTSDTIFRASIIWMGTGQINYPKKFNSKYPFNYSNKKVPMPADIKYLDMNGTITNDSSIVQKGHSVWKSIRSLSIVKNISTKKYKAALYFYPPSVGKFDPSVAKWIVFLYYKD